ncbi:MAG: hypothetical protein HZC17_09985 [Candidatus Omnitrophica bacterium]|nr:hypothetical protein [Candidatus Omnitrophota bacterium]
MKKFLVLVVIAVIFGNAVLLYAEEAQQSLKDYKNDVFQQDDQDDELLDS